MGGGGLFRIHQTIANIPCCKCGTPLVPNAVNMCVKCLQSEVDITQGLQKQFTISRCPKCERYLKPPRTWIKAQLESTELLCFCLNKLKLNNYCKYESGSFIWTEPHSKRIKVKLKVSKDNLSGVCVVEYVVVDHMCESCSRFQANSDQWVAKVQLRQHVSHRRTFFYLEQLILKHNAAVDAISIKQMNEGIDFFFANRSHALKFVDFVGKVVPIKIPRDSKKLISHDPKGNKYDYKHTFSVEIFPICREDLICLPPEVSLCLGNFGPLVLCTKLTSSIYLLDPFTLRHAFVDANQYAKVPFRPLLSCKQLVEYIVLYLEPVTSYSIVGGSKYTLANVEVARVSDFGRNDRVFSIKSHLGHLLKPGDYALGYDLYGANINDSELDKYKRLVIPDAILVKKSYEEIRQKTPRKLRPWKLRSLNMEVDDTSRKLDEEKLNTEYEEFLKDLEENPELRFNISLYRDKEYQPSETMYMTDGDDVPTVPLEELLADLDISDEEDDKDIMSE